MGMKIVPKRVEQHIAVFGESGSGKTVLLSSFYGAMQEPAYIQKSLFNVVSDDIGQGHKLHKNYLGMRNSSTLPPANRFSSTSYSFSLKLKDSPKKGQQKQADALRLVWHDYPGEWFEQSVSGPEEAERRIATFRALLGSDVAVLLIDAQRMIDNSGEEEKYFKHLFTNFRNSLLSLKDELLVDGKLVEFPRVWVMGLSKSDLLPNVDVYQFRDLLIEKACEEIDELRQTLSSLIEGSEAFAFGEDFILLSSAKFEPKVIALDTRVGVDLVLPIAAILPFERHVRWAKAKQLPGRVAENLLRGTGAFAAAMLGKKPSKFPVPLGVVLKFIDPGVVTEAARLAGDGLAALNAAAREKNDILSVILTRFKLDLDKGEKDKTLLRSLK